MSETTDNTPLSLLDFQWRYNQQSKPPELGKQLDELSKAGALTLAAIQELLAPYNFITSSEVKVEYPGKEEAYKIYIANQAHVALAWVIVTNEIAKTDS